MSSSHALALCALFAGVGTIVDACELIRTRESNESAFRWDVLSTLTVHTWRSSRIFQLGAHSLGSWTQFARILAAVGTSTALAAAPGTWLGPVLAGGCLLLQVFVQNRLVFGLDGADQMLTIVWAGVAISGISPIAGVTLIGAQALLAYCAAGVAKVAGAEWRSGVAAERIVRTAGHGSPAVASLLAIKPIGRLATWGTMAFELLAPLLLLFGASGGLVFVLVAMIFHASIAWGMGLNNFVWAFAAALPALYFAAAQVSLLA